MFLPAAAERQVRETDFNFMRIINFNFEMWNIQMFRRSEDSTSFSPGPASGWRGPQSNLSLPLLVSGGPGARAGDCKLFDVWHTLLCFAFISAIAPSANRSCVGVMMNTYLNTKHECTLIVKPESKSQPP